MNILFPFQIFLSVFIIQCYYDSIIANKNFKFEIKYEINKYTKTVTMNYEMTIAFIEKMKNFIEKVIGKDATLLDFSQECERFSNINEETTKQLAIQTICNMLMGKERIDANNKCFHNWVLYLHLTQISKIILEKLETDGKIFSDPKKKFIRKVDEKFYNKIMAKLLANTDFNEVTGKIEKNHAWKFSKLLESLDYGKGLTVDIRSENDEHSTSSNHQDGQSSGHDGKNRLKP